MSKSHGNCLETFSSSDILNVLYQITFRLSIKKTLYEVKNEIFDNEEDSASNKVTMLKLEPKVELTEEILNHISDDKLEDEQANRRERQDKSKQNISSELKRSVPYLCFCSFTVSDNDKSKRLSYIQLRHKNIDSNCLNFIKAITQSQS